MNNLPKTIIVCIIIAVICLGFLVICSLRSIEQMFRQERNAAPVGMNYIEPEDFYFPQELGFCDSVVAKFPKGDNEEKLLLAKTTYKKIHYAVTSRAGNILGYVAQNTHHYYAPDILVWQSDNGPEELFQADTIFFFSVAPDTSEIVLVARLSDAEEPNNIDKDNCFLFRINRLTKYVEKSMIDGFNLSDTPIWLSKGAVIASNKWEGIVKYNFTDHDMEVLVSGKYEQPLLWKNKLIFRKSDSSEVFMSDLDGSNAALFFKNQYADAPLSISPDGKYIACSSSYNKDIEDTIPLKKLPYGVSLFVMNLEDKTFTYFMAPKRKGLNSYSYGDLSWYPGR